MVTHCLDPLVPERMARLPVSSPAPGLKMPVTQKLGFSQQKKAVSDCQLKMRKTKYLYNGIIFLMITGFPMFKYLTRQTL